MKHREPLDAIAGAVGGAAFGFFVWLALSNIRLYLSMAIPWLSVEGAFPLDVLAIVAVGAIVGSLLGYWKGTGFFKWLRDHTPGADPS